MFSLFRKKKSILESGLLRGFTDRHSHILPGVDDGFPTMEKSLEALDYMEQAGVKKVWLTPHIMEDMPNTTDGLRARFAELSEAYKGGITLQLAAENMIDNLFLERWAQQDLLTMDDNMLLVETSYASPPIGLYEILGEILARGYTPLLAHPERYKYMDSDDYMRLKAMGIKFQLNLGAITGGYSKATQQKAASMLRRGMYDYAGSDVHRLRFYVSTVGTPLPAADIADIRAIAAKA